MKSSSCSLIAILIIVSAPAGALPIIDISVSAGLNHSRVDALDFSTADHSGTEPRVTFNLSVTPFAGVEAGWSRLATSATVVTIVPPGAASGGGAYEETVHDSGSLIWLAYAPSVRFDAFELGGKVGVARVKRDLALPRIDIALSSVSDNEVLYGVTGIYWFTDTMGIRLDAERIGSDVTQAGVSLSIGF